MLTSVGPGPPGHALGVLHRRLAGPRLGPRTRHRLRRTSRRWVRCGTATRVCARRRRGSRLRRGRAGRRRPGGERRGLGPARRPPADRRGVRRAGCSPLSGSASRRARRGRSPNPAGCRARSPPTPDSAGTGGRWTSMDVRVTSDGAAASSASSTTTLGVVVAQDLAVALRRLAGRQAASGTCPTWGSSAVAVAADSPDPPRDRLTDQYQLPGGESMKRRSTGR